MWRARCLLLERRVKGAPRSTAHFISTLSFRLLVEEAEELRRECSEQRWTIVLEQVQTLVVTGAL